jgi:AcrR family transcriptional regulator
MVMKLKEDIKREQRCREIMTAARRIFIDKGFDRSTMAEIAKEAEISTSTIYIYFKGKEDLYASLSIDILEYLLAKLDGIKQEVAVPAADQLQRLKDVFVDLYDYDTPIIINMFKLQSSHTMHNISPDLLKEMNTLSVEMICKIIAILKKNNRKSSIFYKRPVVLANILWGLFAGITIKTEMNNLINRPADSVSQKIELAFDIFMKGVDALSAVDETAA